MATGSLRLKRASSSEPKEVSPAKVYKDLTGYLIVVSTFSLLAAYRPDGENLSWVGYVGPNGPSHKLVKRWKRVSDEEQEEVLKEVYSL